MSSLGTLWKNTLLGFQDDWPIGVMSNWPGTP